MSGHSKGQGLRLSTKLILTYSFVALIAVMAAVAVALPLLQQYQNDRIQQERQRIILQYSQRLEYLRGVIVSSSATNNPFRENLSPNPKANPNNRIWLSTPAIETVRQRFNDLAQSSGLRLLVLTNRDREVKVDTELDDNLSWQGETIRILRQPLPVPTAAPGATRAPGTPSDALVSISSGREYSLVFSRQLGGENVPNLFGLNNQQQSLPYVMAAVLPATPVPEVWRDLALILVLAAVAALLVALLAGFLLARSLSRPLVRLTEATHAVARGDYEQQVAPEGGYELSRLSQSFNQMTRNVAEAQRMQRQLLANVSHELKTPLTSIQGFSQAMLDGALRRPEDYARPAQIISNEAERMIRLVNGLLDLSKLESGQAALNLREIDLAGLLKEGVESFAPVAEANSIDLLAEFRPPLMLLGDPDRLRQVFNNLIDNALKYTPPSGQVRVAAYWQGHNIIASVTDTGSGIPAVDLPHIFERFYQADKSRRRDLAQGGSGLGLAITREIVLAHGGKISATSAEGESTRFMLTLPALVNNIANTDFDLGSNSYAKTEVVNKK